MAKKREKTIKAYMCGVTWQHEIGQTDVKVYPSAGICEKLCNCTRSCGIVEVEVRLKKWMVKQDLKIGRKGKKKK